VLKSGVVTSCEYISFDRAQVPGADSSIITKKAMEVCRLNMSQFDAYAMRSMLVPECLIFRHMSRTMSGSADGQSGLL
jgi:hypothetical protein